jgi:hypothetical protein
MKFDYIARVRTGIILIVVFALYSNWQLLLGTVRFDLSFVGNDDITLYQRRFDGVRKMLPPYGVVGYVGDARNNADGSLNAVAMRNWYLAQYTLAPVVLSHEPGQRLVLMNKSPDATESTGPEAGGFTVQDFGFGNKILDFGNGVKLLRNESQ